MQHAQRYKARPVLQIGRSPFFRFCLNSSMGMAGLKPYGLIPAFRNQRPCTRRWTLYLSAKPRRPKSRFRISLSLSRWEIGVAKRLFARASRGLFAEQRKHGLSCYEPGARDQARKKTITFFAWKQAALQISFTISNEIGVYRHQLHIRDICRLIRLLWIAWCTQMCMKPKGIGR